MKQNIKLNLINLVLVFTAIVALDSCVKSRDGATNFDNLKPNVLIREGGLATFSTQALVFPGTDSVDTAYFRINYAATNVAPSDVTVTLAYNDNARTSYNSSSTDSPYAKFPDSVYSFTSTKVTIKAGQQFSDLIPIVIYPNKVDPTKNYMFPITITDASGVDISGNFGTIYYHLIGNPLAGSYIQDYYRWNNSDTTLSPNSTVNEGEQVTISPVNGTTLQFPEGYLTANGIGTVSLSFTNTGGVITDPTVFLNDATKGNISAGGFKVVDGPKLAGYTIVGDASTHYAGTSFRIYFEILNSSGGDRKTINVFTKQ